MFRPAFFGTATILRNHNSSTKHFDQGPLVDSLVLIHNSIRAIRRCLRDVLVTSEPISEKSSPIRITALQICSPGLWQPAKPLLSRCLAVLLAFCAVTCRPATASAEESVSFLKDIAPVLLEHCTSCHGPKKAEGGYRVDTFAQLSRAGDSGTAPLVREGDAPSELIRRLTSEDASERMPAEHEPLPVETIELFKCWLNQGSNFDGADATAPLFELVPDRVYPAPPERYSAPVAITAVTFSHDGAEVIAAGYHEVTVWSAATGELVRRIQNLPQRIVTLEWSADRKWLAAAGGTPGRIGEVRVIDWGSGHVVKSFGRATDVVQTVRFQPHGELVITGNSDGTLRWFDTRDWNQVRTLSSHADSVTDIRWSADGKRLVSGSRDKTAKVVAVESSELLATYSGHAEAVYGVCFHADDKEIISTGADRKVHRWQIDGSKNLSKLDLPAVPTRLHVDAASIWLTLTDRTFRALEPGATKLAAQSEPHDAWVTTWATHRDSNQIASGALNGEIRLWKLDDGKLTRAWTAAPGASKLATQ